MSLQDRHLDPESARTRQGMGRLGESGPGTANAGPAAAFRLGAQVGRGGKVFDVDGPAPSGRLVIKLLPWGAGLDADVVRNFTREAREVASLHHPHLVQVLDAGALDDGTPFVIMQRLTGQTLDEQIRGQGGLPVAEVLPIVRGITSALTAAHAAGVVHRELRADNVFMVNLAGYQGGFPRLLDFGVSRLTAAARRAGRVMPVDATGAVAPEERREPPGGADARSDQFALAALAYRLLTGAAAPPEQAGAPAFERLRDGPVHPAALLARDAPAVAAVLRRGMSWRPESRFDSVAAFFQAFEAAADTVALVTSHDVPRVAPIAVAVAPPSPPAPLPASLTQQFFSEGERQEAAAAAGAASTDADDIVDDDDDDDAQSAAVEELAASSSVVHEVPRRRAPLLAAAALGVTAIALVTWSARSLWRHEAPTIDVPADVRASVPASFAAPSSGAARPAPGAAVASPSPSPSSDRPLRRALPARPGRRLSDPAPYAPPATPVLTVGTPAAVVTAPAPAAAAPAAARIETAPAAHDGVPQQPAPIPPPVPSATPTPTTSTPVEVKSAAPEQPASSSEPAAPRAEDRGSAAAPRPAPTPPSDEDLSPE